jgi:DNA polymerase-3 subunit delta'
VPIATELATELLGQERVVEGLDAAAERPVHAYLIVGPNGSGAEAAARYLAGRLVAADDRAWRLIEQAIHPDVVEFEPSGQVYKVEQIREAIILETMRAPIEGERKVVIVFEAERLCSTSNRGAGANAFLKTLEEPAPRTVIILVTSAADQLLPTVRSRCSRFDVSSLADATIRAALITDSELDLTESAVDRAVALGGGQLGRSRRLATNLSDLRLAFASAPSELDGYGATVARAAAGLDAAIAAAVAELETEQASELAEFDAEMERLGYEPRVARAQRKRLTDRQTRELRKARIDLMMEGVAAIESVIFDALSGAPPRNDDVVALTWNPRRCAEALDACRATRAAVAINEKGTLHLEHLLLALSGRR